MNCFEFGGKLIYAGLNSKTFNIRWKNIEISLPNYLISDVLTIISKRRFRHEYWKDVFNHYSIVCSRFTIWMDFWVGEYEVVDRLIC